MPTASSQVLRKYDFRVQEPDERAAFACKLAAVSVHLTLSIPVRRRIKLSTSQRDAQQRHAIKQAAA